MIFLDTHAAVLLFDETKNVPRKVWAVLSDSEGAISPMACLELEFLHEIGKIRHQSATVSDYLARNLDLTVETEGWARAAEIAQVLNWTWDPFDRLIVAHAMAWRAPLLTRDALMHEHYPLAFGDAVPPQGWRVRST